MSIKRLWLKIIQIKLLMKTFAAACAFVPSRQKFTCLMQIMHCHFISPSPAPLCRPPSSWKHSFVLLLAFWNPTTKLLQFQHLKLSSTEMSSESGFEKTRESVTNVSLWFNCRRLAPEGFMEQWKHQSFTHRHCNFSLFFTFLSFVLCSPF